MLGEEEPRERPQAESLLCREHSWEHFPASPPAGSASQAVALPKQLCFPSGCMIPELKREPKCLVVAGAAGGICFRPSSPGTGTQKGRGMHSNRASLAIAGTYWQPTHSGDNFPAMSCDLVATLSPCRIHCSTSEHVGSSQSAPEVLPPSPEQGSGVFLHFKCL